MYHSIYYEQNDNNPHNMMQNSNLADVSVSICIASYNMKDTIEKSLKSITNDLPNNFEIVIVDQSTDGSKELIKNVASNSDLSYKMVFAEHRLGVGHARNIAVCEATGDIVITHVDVDDWYDSQYFPALVELYLVIKKKRGTDFFFSCPNMNISSREFMKENYMLSSLPIGANEKEYRWRAHRNEDYIGLELDEVISGRIKLSDRKTFYSRMRRTYLRHLGMYKIGYTTRRIIKEDIIISSWPLYSRIFRALILPIVWIHSLFTEKASSSPIDGKTLPEVTTKSTYKLNNLKRIYDIDDELLIGSLANES